MSDIAIRVENLGKQYHIGKLQARYQTLRESITEAVQAPFRRVASVVRGHSSVASNETIWALRNVSFEAKRGEVVGVVGSNGAGKTTFLKILSRITEPTEGFVEIRGRVGSLLEVGTGFHQELTGRENIYLNGAILGMKQAEIRRKFDEIVAFSEVDKFLDTPVKHYSSGMYVRLAFAVAAHLEPEILLVDEVLAVGDVAFQKKCLGKMDEVAKAGRTVLFVSHNMAAVLNLCETGILLSNGTLVYSGTVHDVVNQYLTAFDRWNNISLKDRTDRVGSGVVRIVACTVSGKPAGEPVTDLMLGDETYITLRLEATEPTQLFVGIQMKDTWGRLVFAFNSRESGFSATVERGETDIVLHIPSLPVLDGRYILDATVHSTHKTPYDKIEQVGSFVIHTKDVYRSGKPFNSRQHGTVFIDHKWIGCSKAENNGHSS